MHPTCCATTGTVYEIILQNVFYFCGYLLVPIVVPKCVCVFHLNFDVFLFLSFKQLQLLNGDDDDECDDLSAPGHLLRGHMA